MKAIYLAGRFTRKSELKIYAKALESLGYTITSRWLTQADEAQLDGGIGGDATPDFYADRDTTDIQDCDILLEFTKQDPPYRGGHIWEAGYAYGLGKKVFSVGPKENVFHAMTNIRNFPKWEQALEFFAWKMVEHGFNVD